MRLKYEDKGELSLRRRQRDRDSRTIDGCCCAMRCSLAIKSGEANNIG